MGIPPLTRRARAGKGGARLQVQSCRTSADGGIYHEADINYNTLICLMALLPRTSRSMTRWRCARGMDHRQQAAGQGEHRLALTAASATRQRHRAAPDHEQHYTALEALYYSQGLAKTSACRGQGSKLGRGHPFHRAMPESAPVNKECGPRTMRPTRAALCTIPAEPRRRPANAAGRVPSVLRHITYAGFS